MAVQTRTEAGVERLDVSAYEIPTDEPESDGTLEWDSTTIVVVEAHAGGETGLGYTYGPAATGTLVEEKLVSEVEGVLAPGQDALHAYAAALNMGTLVGAPKIRAAELLREVERSRRGAYGGAVGYLAHDGSLDTAIVIRAAVVRDGIAAVLTRDRVERQLFEAAPG